MDIWKQIKILDNCINRQTELYADWSKKHGLSYNTLLIFFSLDNEDGRTQKRIAEEWGIPKQTIHTIVKSLVKSGYIYYQQEEGKREKKLYFTDSGKAYARRRLHKLYEIEERALIRLGPQMTKYLIESQSIYTQLLEEEFRNE